MYWLKKDNKKLTEQWKAFRGDKSKGNEVELLSSYKMYIFTWVTRNNTESVGLQC